MAHPGGVSVDNRGVRNNVELHEIQFTEGLTAYGDREFGFRFMLRDSWSVRDGDWMTLDVRCGEDAGEVSDKLVLLADKIRRAASKPKQGDR